MLIKGNFDASIGSSISKLKNSLKTVRLGINLSIKSLRALLAIMAAVSLQASVSSATPSDSKTTRITWKLW
ncbi:hypothetical protein CC78DRAFT_112284 [Lojkania enalia]|uniref:Uncharacterized protein n=1 Tax=Lojkania enalia TaxID=147567 RepID=A0A9P4N636_9PLEO|nr:hypothetical protein CC78DRAFT_112284 [Didymosphaeria enalia]